VTALAGCASPTMRRTAVLRVAGREGEERGAIAGGVELSALCGSASEDAGLWMQVAAGWG
jgi:hypothetical protein